MTRNHRNFRKSALSERVAQFGRPCRGLTLAGFAANWQGEKQKEIAIQYYNMYSFLHGERQTELDMFYYITLSFILLL